MQSGVLSRVVSAYDPPSPSGRLFDRCLRHQMQVSIGPTALCVGVALFIFSFSFPPRGAKTRLRRVHYGPKIAERSSNQVIC